MVELVLGACSVAVGMKSQTKAARTIADLRRCAKGLGNSRGPSDGDFGRHATIGLCWSGRNAASPAYHQPGGFMPDATSEKQDRMLADHEKLLANQARILEGLEMIKANQTKLDQILANQEKILGSVGS